MRFPRSWQVIGALTVLALFGCGMAGTEPGTRLPMQEGVFRLVKFNGIDTPTYDFPTNAPPYRTLHDSGTMSFHDNGTWKWVESLTMTTTENKVFTLILWDSGAWSPSPKEHDVLLLHSLDKHYVGRVQVTPSGALSYLSALDGSLFPYGRAYVR